MFGLFVVIYDLSEFNNYGVNFENFGVVFDVWVENLFVDELGGFD